mgnify:FL=1
MSFQPHPAQVQALRTAKRFRKGFRPVKVNGEPLSSTSFLSHVGFKQIPSQILVAETGHLCTPGERAYLLEDLCDRGYLKMEDGYPKCLWAPMEYQTEDGARIFVRDEHWSEIDVLRPDAVLPNGKVRVRHYISGTQGRIEFKVKAAGAGSGSGRKRTAPAGGSNRNRRRDKGGPGSCYVLLPDGFRLLDQHDQGEQKGRASVRAEWSPPDGYVGRKTVCADLRFKKKGKNPSPTTIDGWVKSAKNNGQPIDIEKDPANRENYYPEDWIMERIHTWNPRTPQT